MDNIATWSAANNLKLNVLKSKEIVFRNSRRRTATTSPQPLPGISRENVLKILWVTISHKPPVSVRTYQWQRAIAVCASRAAAARHDWDRPTRRLPSGRRVAADVRVTRVERVHHGDVPPTRRRIAQSQQAMWLLSTRLAGLRPAVTGGRRSTVCLRELLNNPQHTLYQLLPP